MQSFLLPSFSRPNSVFASATYLIYQTNQLMVTVRNKCD